LLIEDSAASAALLTRYLDEMQVLTIVHPEGSGALERVIEETPDTVLLDLVLPDLDGWQLLAMLKSDPRTRGTPVLVISDLDERVRGLALGADEYLVKPVSREELRDALKRLMAGSSAHALGATLPCRGTAVQGPLLLLAEDNDISASMFIDFLEQVAGFRVARARDGEEAIRLAGELKPRMILMDIQMPVVDGLEATSRLRSASATRSIPIIALTALAMPGDRERCLHAGADAYLSKPVSLRELRGLIEDLLRTTRRHSVEAGCETPA
jgi:CheY-like chemotaxis protein